MQYIIKRRQVAQVRQGDTVAVHYTGTLENGTEFDSSMNREPLQFTVGEGNIIPGFEQAVVGMRLGESKTQTVSASQAYGSHRKEF
jgi:peptidylprolyl isomerase